MKSYLVVGVGGSGKSTLAKELVNHGYLAYDMDDVRGLCHWDDDKGVEVKYVQ